MNTVGIKQSDSAECIGVSAPGTEHFGGLGALATCSLDSSLPPRSQKAFPEIRQKPEKKPQKLQL